jgi:hypothetical protein
LATTLLDILTNAADMADMPVPADEDEFVTHTTAVRWANDGLKELHRIATSGAKPLYFRTDDFTLSGSSHTADLPEDFSRLLGLDLNPGTANRQTVTRFNFAERNDYRPAYLSPVVCRDRHYALVGSLTMEIEPQERAAGNYRVYYVPTPTPLADDDDEIDPELEPYAEYVAIALAIKMAAKEESFELVRELKEKRNVMRVDILEALESDQAGPATVIDVYGGE